MATSLINGWDDPVRTNPASGLYVTERPWNGARDADAFGKQPATGNPNVRTPGLSNEAAQYINERGVPAKSAADAAATRATQATQAAAAADANAAAARAAQAPTVTQVPKATPTGVVGRTAAAAGSLASSAGKLLAPVGLTAGALDGAHVGFNTPTEDYARRFGLTDYEPGLLMDTAVRGVGVVSDVANSLTGGLIGKGFNAVAGRDVWGGQKPATEKLADAAQSVVASGTVPVGPGGSAAEQIRQNTAPTTTPAVTAAQPAAPMGLRDQVYAADGAYNPNVIVRQGNSYSGGNVGANAQMFDRADNGTLNLRNPGGGMVAPSGGSVSPQNQAAARSLASAYGQQATPWSGVIGQESGVGNMWSRSPEQLRRDAEVQASSIHKPTSARGAAALKALNDQDLQGVRNQGDFARADASLQGDLARSAATRYSADQNLAGDMAKTAATGRNGLRDAQLKMVQNQGLAQALQAAGGDPVRAQAIALSNGWDPSPLSSMATQRTSENKAQQDLARDASKAATDRFAVYGKGKDGQPFRDDQATQHRLNALNGVIPGFSTMSEEAQAQHIPRAQALMGIWDAARNQNTEGFGSLFSGIGGKPPQLDTMPNFQGGELRRNGLAGTVIPGASSGSYYINKGGKDYSLGDLSQDQINLINNHIRTGKW